MEGGRGKESRRVEQGVSHSFGLQLVAEREDRRLDLNHKCNL